MRMPPGIVAIRSISRGIAVLQAVNRGRPLSMAEIAEASEVPYPTACRIVQTLMYERMIEREPNRRRYRPTALVQTLAHGFQGRGPLVPAARPHIEKLTRELGWPLSLTTHVGPSMIIQDSTHALTSLTFNTYFPGYALPILECSAGQVYIAHVPDPERESILASLEVSDRPASHALQLMREEETIWEIRRHGYSTRDYNQFTKNPGKTSSISVPIFEDGAAVGALTLAFFSSAIGMREALFRFEAPLKQCSVRISQDLAERFRLDDISMEAQRASFDLPFD